MNNVVRQIRQIGNGSKYIVLPAEWAELDEFVKCEIINENEMRVVKLDVTERVNKVK